MTLAERLVDARLGRRTIARPGETQDRFDLKAGYEVARDVDAALRALGWLPVGRKLGFTNTATWKEFDLRTPIWSYVYDRTVISGAGPGCAVAVSDLVAPRIEPELVVGLNAGIASMQPDCEAAELAAAVDWIAPGFEIVDCHYPGWRFDAAEIVADFGAHARLVIGDRVSVASERRASLATSLAGVSVELRGASGVVDTGSGSNALGGPLSAVAFLLRTLADQPASVALTGGEMVTTGTLTGFPYVRAGETWTASFDGAGLGALTVHLS